MKIYTKLFLKLAFLTAAIMLLVSCEKAADGTNDAVSRLVNMKSYKTGAAITYISDKSTSEYTGTQYAVSDGKYCIEIVQPRENAGDKVLYDGKMIWHYSRENDDKISVAIPDRPERQQILLFAFTENMLKTGQANTETEGEYTVLEAQMPDLHRYMKTEKLWINNSTQLPERLIVYDDDNKERVIVEFFDFKYNEEIDSDVFTIGSKEA